MTTQSEFVLDLATLIPVGVGVFVFFTLAALVFGAALVRERADGSKSLFSFDGDGGGDGGGCGGGCGG